jgi:hypothetical protein
MEKNLCTKNENPCTLPSSRYGESLIRNSMKLCWP